MSRDEQYPDATVPGVLQYSSYSARHQARPNSATVLELQYRVCYSTAGPTLFNSAHLRLGCHIHSPLGLDVLVEASNQLTHTGQEQDLLSWLTTVCPSANQHMYTSVRSVLTAHPRCPRTDPHTPVYMLGP